MNATTAIPFPPARLELKVRRRAVSVPLPPAEEPVPAAVSAAFAAERRRLAEDAEALREREENLREYEAHLRALQDEMDATRATGGPAPARTAVPFVAARPASAAPFAHDPGLDAAWQKLHRSRELLEAEQNYLRDDRLAMQAREEQMKLREEAVAAREEAVAAREQAMAAAVAQGRHDSGADGQTTSAFARFTRAPFQMAGAVFSGKK